LFWSRPKPLWQFPAEYALQQPHSAEHSNPHTQFHNIPGFSDSGTAVHTSSSPAWKSLHGISLEENTMFDLYRSRTDAQALLNHAEPEAADGLEPMEKFEIELEIELCPQQERIDALESVTVSLPIQVECELDLLNAQMNNWEIQRVGAGNPRVLLWDESDNSREEDKC